MDATAYHESFAKLSRNAKHDLITDAIRAGEYSDEDLAVLCGITQEEVMRVRLMGPRDRSCDRPPR